MRRKWVNHSVPQSSRSSRDVCTAQVDWLRRAACDYMVMDATFFLLTDRLPVAAFKLLVLLVLLRSRSRDSRPCHSGVFSQPPCCPGPSSTWLLVLTQRRRWLSGFVQCPPERNDDRNDAGTGTCCPVCRRTADHAGCSKVGGGRFTECICIANSVPRWPFCASEKLFMYSIKPTST